MPERPSPCGLSTLYAANKSAIIRREALFERFLKHSSEKRTFAELAFCLLTPQSNAVNCWSAVRNMKRNRVLFEGSAGDISEYIACARFRNKKAEYIVLARELLTESGKISIKKKLSELKSPRSAREWFADSIKGMGYKESSHFLRNVGKGRGLAILDRHILRNLNSLGIIPGAPESLTRKKYLEIEKEMIDYTEQKGIPLNHLDLLLWFKETGKFFK